MFTTVTYVCIVLATLTVFILIGEPQAKFNRVFFSKRFFSKCTKLASKAYVWDNKSNSVKKVTPVGILLTSCITIWCSPHCQLCLTWKNSNEQYEEPLFALKSLVAGPFMLFFYFITECKSQEAISCRCHCSDQFKHEIIVRLYCRCDCGNQIQAWDHGATVL